MKKFVQYLLGFGLAFLVFAAILVSETTRFNLLQEVGNPFAESKNLEKEIIVASEEHAQEVFTREGELWIFYPDSKTDFAEENREVIQGEVFLSSYFTDYESYLSNPETGFSVENFALVPGWLKVGPLVLNISGSNILVNRDSVKNWTEIYVFGHSIEVYFEGAFQPFVIPSNMQVTIRENLVNDKTNSLFYSKLKKDFQMKSFALSSASDEDSTDKLNKALKILEIWKEKITKFALMEPETWLRSHQNNFTSRLVESIEAVQNNVALGLDPEVKEKRTFRKLIKPFVRTHFFIKNRKTALAQKSLKEFEKSIKNSSWKEILKHNLIIQNQWENFIKAHDAWLKTILPGSTEEILVDFWFNQSTKKPFPKIIKTFSDAENLFSNRYFRKAKKEFSKLNENLKKVDITAEESFQITKMRRLFVELLKQEEFFQNEEMFKLHKFFIETELHNHENQEFLDEIRLESSQDLLWFLNTFLEDKTKGEISKIMLRTYKLLETNKVMERLGRDIFTPEENELIKLITLIGNTGLTKEELDAIKESKEYQEELNDRIIEIQQKKEQPEEIESGSFGQITNAKDLKTLLTEKGVDTQKMNFQTNRREGTTTFSEGKWKGHSVSGTFDFTTQFFKDLRTGNEFQAQLNLRFLEGFLNKTSEEKKSFLKEVSDEETAIIPQTTSRAILERKLVQELFILKGFKVSRSKVKIIDEEMTTFRIQEALLDRNYKLNFTYERETDLVRDITTTTGISNIDFGSRTFPLEGLNDVLREEFQALIKKK